MNDWTVERPTSGRTAEELSAMLHHIYGAAGEPQRWPDVLNAIVESLQGGSGLLYTPMLPAHLNGLLYSRHISPEHNTLWATKYMDLDIWAQRSFERLEIHDGTVATDADVATEDELLASQIYQELLSKMDVGRFCSGCVFEGGPGVPMTLLTVHRPLRSPAFTVQDRSWLALLLPHLSRALGLMYRLDRARLQSESLLVGMDSLPLGVLLVDVKGRLLHANTAARTVFARDDGLRCDAERRLVAAPVAQGGPPLPVWLAAQCSPSVKDVTHFSEGYLVRRTADKGAYSLQCCPIENPQPWLIQQDTVGAIVFVSDPSALKLPDESRLSQLYGLTPAQAKVALQLTQGSSRKEAARLLGISPETVRSHTQVIYQKVRVNSQPDLVRSILTLGHASI